MSLNMKTLTQALAKASAVIEKTVQTTVQEVTGPKPLLDYELLDQIGSAGPGLAWKLYSAKPVRDSSRNHQYPTVCVWVLDKKALSDARTRAGLSKAAEDVFLDIIRADGTRLVKLRHPGVVHVVQALDENKNAMAMVTEPLFASVANVLGNVDNVAKVPKDLKGIEMGLLEVKHGLLQLAESLDFLHNNAQLIHRAISPENVFITSNGAWKLGGFGFAISVDQATGDMANVSAFNYAEYDVEDSVLPLQPSLNYTAPELVRSKAPSAGCSSDIFSYGCLVYHLIARKSLFDCHNNVKMYMNTLNYLSNEVFSSIPPELVPNLQRMLSANESLRPTAKDFTGSPFFRNDTRLRALRFLDHMLERDNMQKSEFLKALSDMWKEFDSRVLRYKVLPPLCAELRNLVMQPMILPMVLIIAESQDTNDFELSTLPALVPVLNSAAGEILLLLVKHAELLINKTSQEQLISHVLPMIVRAYSDNDARIQEEVLRKSVLLAKQLDSELVKLAILPRVHGLALKTTVAAVRVNALLCLGDLVYTLNKHAVLDILQTIQRCTEVDRSSPTLMCTLAVANSILKQLGVEFTAEHVLPLVTPLLTAQQLNVQQFAKYMLFVKNILKKIEEKRGVSVTDSGIPEVKASAPANGLPLQASNIASETVASTAKISPAWDEDWDTPARQTSASLQNSTNITTSSPVLQRLPIQTTHLQSLLIPEASHKQKTESCPSVDIEWPPRASFGITTQSGDLEKHLKTEISSTASFDDMDPFANWPPKPSGSTSVGGLNKGVTGLQSNKYESKTIWNTSNKMNLQKSNSNSWNFAIQSSDEQLKQRQGNSTSTTGSLGIGGSNPQNSIGILKQSQGIIASSTNLGAIYASSKNEKAAPRLAPPPSTPMGRGRVRGSASSSHPIQVKSPSEQPPLLDLL